MLRSPSGNDANPGTITEPFRTIAKGVSVVQAGDVVSLRGGVYVEPVVIAGKHGTGLAPGTVRHSICANGEVCVVRLCRSAMRDC